MVTTPLVIALNGIFVLVSVTALRRALRHMKMQRSINVAYIAVRVAGSYTFIHGVGTSFYNIFSYEH